MLTAACLDRDCALTLGRVQTILNTAILQLSEDVAPIALKTEAVAAIGKVCRVSAFPATPAWFPARHFG